MVKRNIPFIAQHAISIEYKEIQLTKKYIADFVVYEKLLVEIKALDNLTERDEAQLINYLKATGMELGVLINFGCHPNLQWKRLAATAQNTICSVPLIILERISED